MELRGDRVDVRATAVEAVEVEWSFTGDRLTWSVANRSDAPVAVDAVAVVAAIDPVREPLRVLRHGYQSWSPTAVATFRVDEDGSRAEGVRSLPIGMHHADWATAEPDELRSEMVTVLQDDTGALLVAGFLGGWEHDGTFRVRPAPDGGFALCLRTYVPGEALLAGSYKLPNVVRAR